MVKIEIHLNLSAIVHLGRHIPASAAQTQAICRGAVRDGRRFILLLDNNKIKHERYTTIKQRFHTTSYIL